MPHGPSLDEIRRFPRVGTDARSTSAAFRGPGVSSSAHRDSIPFTAHGGRFSELLGWLWAKVVVGFRTPQATDEAPCQEPQRKCGSRRGGGRAEASGRLDRQQSPENTTAPGRRTSQTRNQAGNRGRRSDLDPSGRERLPNRACCRMRFKARGGRDSARTRERRPSCRRRSSELFGQSWSCGKLMLVGCFRFGDVR